MKLIQFLINNTVNFGWAWWISLIYPIYWTQDAQYSNNGYDILSVRKPKSYYFQGTWFQRTYFFN